MQAVEAHCPSPALTSCKAWARQHQWAITCTGAELGPFQAMCFRRHLIWFPLQSLLHIFGSSCIATWRRHPVIRSQKPSWHKSVHHRARAAGKGEPCDHIKLSVNAV